MRNGTQSNRLTLVDRNGRQIPGSVEGEETSAEYVADPNSSDGQRRFHIRDQRNQTQLVTFAAVSIGCAAAAIVTGSYALWLSRRRLADQALLSVHDLLETCRERVARMEEELTNASSAPSLNSAS